MQTAIVLLASELVSRHNSILSATTKYLNTERAINHEDSNLVQFIEQIQLLTRSREKVDLDIMDMAAVHSRMLDYEKAECSFSPQETFLLFDLLRVKIRVSFTLNALTIEYLISRIAAKQNKIDAMRNIREEYEDQIEKIKEKSNLKINAFMSGLKQRDLIIENLRLDGASLNKNFEISKEKLESVSKSFSTVSCRLINLEEEHARSLHFIEEQTKQLSKMKELDAELKLWRQKTPEELFPALRQQTEKNTKLNDIISDLKRKLNAKDTECASLRRKLKLVNSSLNSRDMSSLKPAMLMQDKQKGNQELNKLRLELENCKKVIIVQRERQAQNEHAIQQHAKLEHRLKTQISDLTHQTDSLKTRLAEYVNQ